MFHSDYTYICVWKPAFVCVCVGALNRANFYACGASSSRYSHSLVFAAATAAAAAAAGPGGPQAALRRPTSDGARVRSLLQPHFSNVTRTMVLVARRGVKFLVLCPRATCMHPTLVEDSRALEITCRRFWFFQYLIYPTIHSPQMSCD